MALPDPPKFSDFALAKMDPQWIAMFRFLLEAYENLAYFTVLERRPALLKISFASESGAQVEYVLRKMQADIPFVWWRLPRRENTKP